MNTTQQQFWTQVRMNQGDSRNINLLTIVSKFAMMLLLGIISMVVLLAG